MAKLIFRLNDAPEDEANAIRALLEEHHIDYYETNSGNWGFSVAGIWIKNDQDKRQARSLIDEYQRQHHSSSPEEVESFLQVLLRQPLRVIIYLGIVFFILYLSVMPFMNMGGE